MIEHIYSGDRTRRIAIFRRPSGTVGYQEEYFFRNDYFPDEVVEGWAQLSECASYYDRVEAAKADVLASVPWLAAR